ncbi:hypothetical protein ACJX0J_011644, partial [Zea mays]
MYIDILSLLIVKLIQTHPIFLEIYFINHSMSLYSALLEAQLDRVAKAVSKSLAWFRVLYQTFRLIIERIGPFSAALHVDVGFWIVITPSKHPNSTFVQLSILFLAFIDFYNSILHKNETKVTNMVYRNFLSLKVFFT